MSPVVVAGGVVLGGAAALEALFGGVSRELLFSPWASSLDKATIAQLAVCRAIVLTTMLLGVGTILLRLCKCQKIENTCLLGVGTAVAKLVAVALLARPLAWLLCRPIGKSCHVLMEPIRVLNGWRPFHVISISVLAMTLAFLVWLLNCLEKKVLALRSFAWRIAAAATIVLSVGAATVALRHCTCSSSGGERRPEEREAPGGEKYRLSEDEPGMMYGGWRNEQSRNERRHG